MRMEQEDSPTVIVAVARNDSPNRRMWTNEEITTIIQEVRSRPFLYDKKHSDYKHHQKKEQAWDMIAAGMENKTLTGKQY